MKLFCKGEYHNSPNGLHFDGKGVIDVDDYKAEFLLKDAPENFKKLPAVVDPAPEVKAPDAPPVDKAVKAPAKKK